VKLVFDQRESQKDILKDKVESKYRQLDYLQKQTRDHAAALARLGASLNINKTKHESIEHEAKDFENRIFTDVVARVGHLCMKGDQGMRSLLEGRLLS
jgi:hypothetical protein